MKYSDISREDLQSWATGKKATRRLLKKKWHKIIDEQYPDPEEAKKVKAKLKRDLDKEMGETNVPSISRAGGIGMGQKGKAFYDALDNLGLTHKSVPISNLEKDYPRIRVANPDQSIFAENQRGVMFSNSRIENSYKRYLEQLFPEQKDNVIKNVKRIKSQVKKRLADERAAKRSKLIKIDKSQFLGATDMSKATTREAIYDHWEAASKLYPKVKETLDKLLEEATNTDIYELMMADLRKKEQEFIRGSGSFTSADERDTDKIRAEVIVLQDLQEEVKKKKEAYDKDLAAIKSKVEKANFEYLVKIDRVKINYQVDAWDRMLDAIARYEAAEKAAQFQEPKANIGGKAGADAQTALRESGLFTEEASNVPAQNKNYAVAEMNEVLADDTIDGAPEEIEEDLREIAAALDPLLAIELVENRKLIALNEQSKDDLKEAIEELKEGANLEFVSEADKWLREIEDSYVLDRKEYILPASVYKSKRGVELKINKLPTAIEDFTLDIGGISEKQFFREHTFKDIIEQSPETYAVWKDGITPAEDLNNLFDAIHILFTSQRYSFIRYSRTQKGAGKTEGVSPAEVERLGRSATVEGKRKLQSLLRPYPVIPARQGQLISGLSDTDKGVGKALADFIEACNEYYVEPFLKGMTPIAYPRYMTGAGIKALTAIGQELGYESMMGNISRRLSNTASTAITQGTMSSLTTFLTMIDEVVVVNDATIKTAKRAVKALTKIFGQEEKNRNTVAAILMHFIEQTRKDDSDTNRSRDDFYGETIQARAKAFHTKKVGSYPIFALYPFLETNQGLLTRSAPMKREYEKLMRTLSEIDDELPEVLTKLLKAHNAIRKAMGKEVITPRFRANHEGYDGLIDLMYKEENIDLSHLEVENIVKAVDSHSNIGKEYGITEEQVYLIKAYVR